MEERVCWLSSRLPLLLGRDSLTLSLIRSLGLQGIEWLSCPPCTAAELLLFHSAGYVATLLHLPVLLSPSSPPSLKAAARAQLLRAGAEPPEAYNLTDDCPIFDELPEYVLRVAGATLSAASSLVRRERPLEAACAWAGGRHHARRQAASGFCYVNDVALAVLYLRRARPGCSVLVVDVDVHHGDGTEAALGRADGVQMISVHMHAQGFFPGTGGAGEGPANATNIPLKRGATDATFLAALLPALEQLQPRGFDFLVWVCGSDCLAGDPLGGLNLTEHAILSPIKRARELWPKAKLLMLGGGGYAPVPAAILNAKITAALCGREDIDQVPADCDSFAAFEPTSFALKWKPQEAAQDENAP